MTLVAESILVELIGQAHWYLLLFLVVGAFNPRAAFAFMAFFLFLLIIL